MDGMKFAVLHKNKFFGMMSKALAFLQIKIPLS